MSWAGEEGDWPEGDPAAGVDQAAPSSMDLKTLISRLNPVLRRALEKAAEETVARTHYDVTPEHLLLALTRSGNRNDFAEILRPLGVERAPLDAALEASLQTLDRGNERTPAFDPGLTKLLHAAREIAESAGEGERIRSGFVLQAALSSPPLATLLHDAAPQLKGLSVESLEENFREMTVASIEAEPSEPDERAGFVARPGSSPSGDGEDDLGLLPPKVFCCYSRRDENSVLPIVRDLRLHECDVWLDQWDIRPGENWDMRIDWALDGAAMLLIFLSVEAVDSEEVRSELRVALDRKIPVVPVVLNECRIPRHLRNIQQVDAQEGLAAGTATFEALVEALRATR